MLVNQWTSSFLSLFSDALLYYLKDQYQKQEELSVTQQANSICLKSLGMIHGTRQNYTAV